MKSGKALLFCIFVRFFGPYLTHKIVVYFQLRNKSKHFSYVTHAQYISAKETIVNYISSIPK